MINEADREEIEDTQMVSFLLFLKGFFGGSTFSISSVTLVMAYLFDNFSVH